MHTPRQGYRRKKVKSGQENHTFLHNLGHT